MRESKHTDILTADPALDAARAEALLIQESLLPTCTLKGAAFEVAFRFLPLSDVGGDFADFFTLPNGHVGLYLGDVVGKGLIAAMYAALVMGTMRGTNKTDEDPATVLALLNKRLLVRPVPERFSSTLYADYDPATHELVFSNAGAPFPLLASKSGCCSIGEGGVPSGMFRDVTYSTYRVKLSPGDAVLFATDGIHELRNEKGEDLAWKMLGELWREAGERNADGALDYLLEKIRPYSEDGLRHDDITAVALKITG